MQQQELANRREDRTADYQNRSLDMMGRRIDASERNAVARGGSDGKPKNQIIYDAQGQGYVIDVNDPTLTPRPIQTGAGGASSSAPPEGFRKSTAGEKSFTLDQSNSATYGKRATEAEQALNDVGTDYSPVAVVAKNAAGRVPLFGAPLEMVANSKLTPNDQKVDQAQRNFVNAVLRKESGSAIAPSEFENATKQYFPQPGDSKEVLALKAQNRATATAGLKNAAGPAWMGDKQPPAAPATKSMTMQQLQQAANDKFGGDINAAKQAAQSHGYSINE